MQTVTPFGSLSSNFGAKGAGAVVGDVGSVEGVVADDGSELVIVLALVETSGVVLLVAGLDCVVGDEAVDPVDGFVDEGLVDAGVETDGVIVDTDGVDWDVGVTDVDGTVVAVVGVGSVVDEMSLLHIMASL